MTNRGMPWFPLNPDLAPQRAFEGARVNGITLLHFQYTDTKGELCDVFTVTGMCSCATRESAERYARLSRDGRDLDRRITAAALNTWRA